ncbi:bestrophin [Mesorhizobium sp. B2-4-12]|uniref:bestrophin family protein n=1 Tax=unclassified Mesorhizobium TaxID=325217 RepID=UPI0011265B0E|nr:MULTISPECIES: bestrophin family ion channel [unclassified Mesorhizobium]TPK88803.1 bestrophin [Mesorhizobium sp. B2-4-17]TPK95618.1 bestrophin [Mesorhizobium sp. B2-4-12]
MIVRETPSLLTLFLEIRGSVIRRIYPRVLIVMALSVFVVWGHSREPQFIPLVDGAPFSLVGIALSIFLGFRNNACYDRWWEGRKLWGRLLAASRDLARQTIVLTRPDGTATGARARLVHLNIIFVDELVRHLRYHDRPNKTADATLSPEEKKALSTTRNVPDYILRLIGEAFARLRCTGAISDIEFSIFDRTLCELNGVLAGCERLRNTPVPFGYTLLLHRTAYLFCFMLPFGLADVLGALTPVAAGVVAYTFFGLDALGDELEAPFGILPNDLPIAAIAKTIEISLREALKEGDLPEMPKPVDTILL